jgi:phosphoglycerate kinase
MPNIQFIDDIEIINKRILIRNDFNVSLNKDHKIANDERIRQAIPTINYLLKQQNKLILTSHLGEPKSYDPSLSLAVIKDDLASFLPGYTITLFPTIQEMKNNLSRQTIHDIFLLENLRFLPGEGTNDPELARLLASLADIYVNDALSVSHREAASIVGIPSLLPAYGGLLLKKELQALSPLLEHPEMPYVVILGGAKISTKLPLLMKLAAVCDMILVGGGLANTILLASGLTVGKSLVETDETESVKAFISHIDQQRAKLILPTDVLVAENADASFATAKPVSEIVETDMILDIGPQTAQRFSQEIAAGKTILWNGPLGYTENPVFKTGTDAVYEAIIANTNCISILGGGDTITAIAKEEHLDKITHISTAGGAMLEYLEKGTLPGLYSLERKINIL